MEFVLFCVPETIRDGGWKIGKHVQVMQVAYTKF